MTEFIEDQIDAEIQGVYLEAIGRLEIYLRWLDDVEKAGSAIFWDIQKRQEIDAERLASIYDDLKDMRLAARRVKSILGLQKAQKIDEFEKALEVDG